MNDIKTLLNSRESSHGDYPSKADYIQKLKKLNRTVDSWERLPSYQKESLDNIAQKMGRILFGDNNFSDHWEDICGYSKLVVDDLYINEGSTEVDKPTSVIDKYAYLKGKEE